jgi:hypothetical protein
MAFFTTFVILFTSKFVATADLFANVLLMVRIAFDVAFLGTLVATIEPNITREWTNRFFWRTAAGNFHFVKTHR